MNVKELQGLIGRAGLSSDYALENGHLRALGQVALEKLKSESPNIVDGCSLAAGLSLGEYTALAFSRASAALSEARTSGNSRASHHSKHDTSEHAWCHP